MFLLYTVRFRMLESLNYYLYSLYVSTENNLQLLSFPVLVVLLVKKPSESGCQQRQF